MKVNLMIKRISLLTMVILLVALTFGCIPPLDCPEPDASKITASRGTIGTGGMIIHGAEGAVEPGATVTITDKDGHIVTTIADENGSFTLMEADLPEDFDHTLGNNLSVTQDSEGCNESSAVNVVISA